MGKYSAQFKATAINAYITGDDGFRKLARRYSVDCSLLRRWVAAYQARDAAGPRTQGRYFSATFKLSVVLCLREEGLSHRQVAARFGLGQSSQVGIWERQYYSGGLAALSASKGKKVVVMSKKPPVLQSPQPVNDESKSREQLQAELEFLRMENAYLKKLEEVTQASKRSHPLGKKRSP
jgi:transposase